VPISVMTISKSSFCNAVVHSLVKATHNAIKATDCVHIRMREVIPASGAPEIRSTAAMNSSPLAMHRLRVFPSCSSIAWAFLIVPGTAIPYLRLCPDRLCSKSTRYRLVYFNLEALCKDRLSCRNDDDYSIDWVPSDEGRLVILDSTGDGRGAFRNCGRPYEKSWSLQSLTTGVASGFGEVADFRFV
jgi:hypothetical protein